MIGARDRLKAGTITAMESDISPASIEQIADDLFKAHRQPENTAKRGKWVLETSVVTWHADSECKTPHLDAVIDIASRSADAKQMAGEVRIPEKNLDDLIARLQEISDALTADKPRQQ